MKTTILVFIGIFAVSGCGYSMFAGKTAMTYKAGDKEISYTSDKEQSGIDASWEGYENGNAKKVTIKVDKSTSQESIVAAALENQRMIGVLLEKLLPLVEKGAMMGGS